MPASVMLIAAPVVALNAPTVMPFATKRVLPDTARGIGSAPSPVMKLALITAPVVALYAPTVVVLFATKRVLPENTRELVGGGRPVNVIKLALIEAPVVE